MTDGAERWQRVEQIVQAALKSGATNRTDFLRDACGDDEELRRAVEELLAQKSTMGHFLATSVPVVGASVPSSSATSLTGRTVNGLAVGPLLGAGGMGEVYKARDARLKRDVAIKVLPAAFARDPQRLRRFEQEARAVAALSHPNVIVIHDVGTFEDAPYVVTELLEGQDLRRLLAGGALPQSRAIELAIELLRGLAAAHENGIVHRDIKPENVFVKTDGHLKILDFGLAKFSAPPVADEDERTRLTVPPEVTEPGMVLGTAGYMSPEQVRGEPVDHRSDVFSFGVVFYEMLTGRRAFAGDSLVDTMSAVLREEPPPLLTVNPKLSPLLDRLVRHCLGKPREQRFRSTRDLALTLEMIAQALGSTTSSAVYSRPVPHFRKVSFRRGNLLSARFTPDGQHAVYSAAWESQPCELYMTRIDGRESRRLGVRNADILSISKTGGLAVLLKDKFLASTGAGPSWEKRGTLAHVPIGGGSPREMLEDVLYADWGPGDDLAVVTADASDMHSQVEYPAGVGRYRARSLAGIRVSPDGTTIALLEDMPTSMSVRLIDENGATRTLVQSLGTPTNIAWSPAGDEILYTRSTSPGETTIYAVTLDGRTRELYRTDGVMQLCDVSRDGRLLLRRQITRVEMKCFGKDDQEERDRSWLDGTGIAAISEDGRTIAFRETETGGGDRFSAYVTSVEGADPIRLGDGWAWDLSPDGKWVMTLDMNEPAKIVLIPTRAGRPLVVQTGDLLPGAGRFITNQRVLFYATGPDGARRLYTATIDSSELKLVTAEPCSGVGVPSPDGNVLALVMGDRRTYLLPVDGGDPALVHGLEPDERPVQWSDDGRWLYVRRMADLPAKVYRVNIASGERELWKMLLPADPVGVTNIGNIVVTRNGLYYGYSCSRVVSSELYVVGGLL